MGWNCLSIPKLQRWNRWSLGMDKQFHPALYRARNYLSILGIKFILNFIKEAREQAGRHFRDDIIGSGSGLVTDNFVDQQRPSSLTDTDIDIWYMYIYNIYVTKVLNMLYGKFDITPNNGFSGFYSISTFTSLVIVLSPSLEFHIWYYCTFALDVIPELTSVYICSRFVVSILGKGSFCLSGAYHRLVFVFVDNKSTWYYDSVSTLHVPVPSG